MATEGKASWKLNKASTRKTIAPLKKLLSPQVSSGGTPQLLPRPVRKYVIKTDTCSNYISAKNQERLSSNKNFPRWHSPTTVGRERTITMDKFGHTVT